MDCDHIIELLPWHLNGTLGEDEGRAVREHLATCPSCRRALAETRQAWEIFDQHIPAAALVAHAAGERPEGIDPALIAAHLATCPECAAELELVRLSRGLAEDENIAVLAPRQPRQAGTGAPAVVRPAAFRWKAAALAAGLAGLFAANGWYQTAEQARILSGRLAKANPPAAPAVPTAPTIQQPPAGTQPPSGVPAQMAPQDAPRVAELQSQLEQMQKTLGELQTAEAEHRAQLDQMAEKTPAAAGPQINTWIGDVGLSGDVVRGGGGDAATEVPARASLATLLLRAGEAQGDREIEIADTQGRVVWKGRDLHLDPVGQDYSLTLHRGDLAPGDYTIRLFRTENGQRVPAESYAIRVK